jgi:hypothetical protein
MKTRTALIYLAIFLIIAGYFYYFEVIRREARLKQEEAAQHLFQVDKTQVTALQLVKADSEPISLKKNGRWLIDEPMKTRADDSVVENLLNTVQGLKMDRQVKSGDQNLQLYGLDKPKLRLSFLSDGNWHHLRIGSKTAVGDKFYASGDQQDLVVLSVLTKNWFLRALKKDAGRPQLSQISKSRNPRSRVFSTGWSGFVPPGLST